MFTILIGSSVIEDNKLKNILKLNGDMSITIIAGDNTEHVYRLGQDITYKEFYPYKYLEGYADIVSDGNISKEVRGKCVYQDGECIIVRASSFDIELAPYLLFYNEVCNRFRAFADDEYRNTTQKYLCIDKENDISLFCLDEDTQEIVELEVYNDGTVDYDFSRNYEEIRPIAQYCGEHFPERIEVSLPSNEIQELENKNAIIETEDAATEIDSSGNETAIPSCASRMNRAVYWLTQCDCAFITSWRSDIVRPIKDESNRILERTLREYGYGVARVKGCYKEEKSQEIGIENSFLVFDLCEDGDLFYDRIHKLSEEYEQDSFLYKKAGKFEPAFLIYTNGSKKGTKELCGRMRIGNMNAENYTRIRSGILTFE